MKKIKINFGPGFIITSAFIGPGTITLAPYQELILVIHYFGV